jgi:hypothetical protein
VTNAPFDRIFTNKFNPFSGNLKVHFCSLKYEIHCYCIQKAMENDPIHMLLQSSEKHKNYCVYAAAITQPTETLGYNKHYTALSLKVFQDMLSRN